MFIVYNVVVYGQWNLTLSLRFLYIKPMMIGGTLVVSVNISVPLIPDVAVGPTISGETNPSVVIIAMSPGVGAGLRVLVRRVEVEVSAQHVEHHPVHIVKPVPM